MAATEKRAVAIVGSGMAGLVTAFLLNRDAKYVVTVFESGDRLSLDSASVSLRSTSSETSPERVDLPMRAFTPGYYKNLTAMYNYLGVAYHPQRLLLTFAEEISDQGEGRSTRPYYTHATGHHKLLPPRPVGVSLISYLVEAAYLLMWFSWLVLCGTCRPPRTADIAEQCETVGQYLKRINMPAYFISRYILPVASSVATCSHDTVEHFPATDLLTYYRLTRDTKNSLVSKGVRDVESRLSKLLDVKFSSRVNEILPQGADNLVRWTTIGAEQCEVKHESRFDVVILAVTPDVVGNIFKPLSSAMANIPTIPAECVVHSDDTVVDEIGMPKTDASRTDREPHSLRPAHHMILRSRRGTPSFTESIHVPKQGIVVATCPFNTFNPSAVLHSWTFTRVLRSCKSREIINGIFCERAPVSLTEPEKVDALSGEWHNGDGGVYVVGGWAWDGMVLLEGCIVSAMRVADALDVDVPWRKDD